MRHLRLNLVRAVTAALVFASTATWVHADCVDGVRDATKAELDFATRARAALIAGLPVFPTSIERRSKVPDLNLRVSLGFCRAQPIGAFDVSVQDGFRYSFTPAEANERSQKRRELLKQIEQIEQLPAEKEAQRKALSDQARAAYDLMPRRSRKDPPFTPEQQALVERQNAEGRRLETASRNVESDHRASVKAQTDPLRVQADAQQQGPQEFNLALAINVAKFSEAGAQALVTFGSPNAKYSAGLVVHNVVLTVTGPDSPARRALVDAVDIKYLQGLVGKAPPEVAASQARITAVVPPTLK